MEHIPESDIVWTKNLNSVVRVNGRWAVPRCGLILQKISEDRWELAEAMPWTPELEAAQPEADVPESAEELRNYQIEEFRLFQSRFRASGIELTDPKSILGGAV